MFLNFFPKKTLFEKRWFFICFVSVFRFVRDFKWKIQEFLRNWKTLVKKRSITLWFWNFSYFHPNLGFWKFLKKVGIFLKKDIIYLVILKFWNFDQIVMKLTFKGSFFFRSFENWLFHIVMHQKLLSKDKNSIWKGRNVWLWWFHSIIRRIFLFWKLFRDSWRKIWALSMDSALKSIFDFPIHAINAFSIQSVRKMVKTQERWRGLVMPY